MGLVRDIYKAYRSIKSHNSNFDWWQLFRHSDTNENRFLGTEGNLNVVTKVGLVSTCMRIIGPSYAKIPWDIKDLNNEVVNAPEVEKLFRRPNPFQTGFEFRNGLAWYLFLTGNAYIFLTAKNMEEFIAGKPGEMWLLRPDRIRVVPDKNHFIKEYVYTVNGKQITIGLDKIVHIKFFNPIHDHLGLGVVASDPMLFDVSFKQKLFNQVFFRNGAALSGALTTDKRMDRQQLSDIRSRWDSEHSGAGNNMKTAILHGGLKYENIGLSHVDMAFPELHKMSREDILSMFGVPPAKAGVLENANYSNSEEQDKTFWSETIDPFRILTMEYFTEIVQRFNPNWKFSFNEVIKVDENVRSERIRGEVKDGILSRNEARIILGHPESGDPAMDQILVPLNFVPIGEVSLGNTENKGLLPPGQKEDKATGNQLRLHRSAVRSKKKAEKKSLKAIRKFLAGQRDRVLEKFDEIFGKSLANYSTKQGGELFIDEDAFLVRDMKPSQTAAVALGAVDATDFLGIDVDTSLTNPIIREAIANVSSKITRVNQTTRVEVTKIIDTGLQEGETLETVRKNIQEKYARWIAKDKVEDADAVLSVSRARMIARTESFAGWDAGAVNTYKEVGITNVDVVGCDGVHDGTDCNLTGFTIEQAQSGLVFHPNHTGSIVPAG